jgi:parallel beta-helix repeat protein
MNNAGNGDTITFQVNGTVSLTGALPAITKNIKIDGTTVQQVKIQGNASSTNQYSIFQVNPGSTAEIDNLWIEGGWATGGGILNTGDLTLVGDKIENNGGNQGAGINNGTPTASLGMQYVTIENNIAVDSGGGIFNDGTIVSAGPDGNNIVANQALNGDGGGVYNLGTMNLAGTIISGNSANPTAGTGGGVYNGGDATFTLLGGSINNNVAYDGGGVYNRGNLTLQNGTQVENNTAYDQGGGLFLQLNSSTTLDIVTVSGNKAQGQGGGTTIANGVGYNTPNTMNITDLTDNDDPGGNPVKLN